MKTKTNLRRSIERMIAIKEAMRKEVIAARKAKEKAKP